MANWDYGGAYLRHDMSGVIELQNDSKVMVQDLTQGMPEFMLGADLLFVDPPCSQGNLRSFHTKADQELEYSFGDFENSLFQRIGEIAPNQVFIEVFASNRDAFAKRLAQMFLHTKIYDSFYYNKQKNVCWIIHASQFPIQELPIAGIDESKAIAWICKNVEFQCIGDLCMGRGLVGKHAIINGRKFVGTELNKKRLAVLVEFAKGKLKLG